MSERCPVRVVLDPYEADTCGEPASFAGYCSLHFKEKLEATEADLKRAEAEVTRLARELAHLRQHSSTVQQFLNDQATERFMRERGYK